jgi:hypothetical protein
MAIPCHAQRCFATNSQLCTRSRKEFHRIFTPLRNYYYFMLRSRRYAVIALCAALLSTNCVSSFAEPTPSLTPTSAIDSFRGALEQFKKDRDVYEMALRDRDMKMRAINTTFKNSVDKSSSDARTAMNIATTPEQKNAITSARRAAVALAIVTRESSIAALGPLPTPPVEPQRPTKMSPQGMSEQKDKKKR